jgi:hypothetical protein
MVLSNGGEYEMWYNGFDSSHTRIGYATSTNGVGWVKHPNNPVLDVGASGTWEERYVQHPTVILDGAKYEMWYTGKPGPPVIDDINKIGYATAPIGNVYIDIKPGSYPNSVNLGSQGVIPVGILSSVDFDATQVDPDTVALAGAGVAIRGKGNGLLAHEEDVNGDGLIW